MALRSDRGRSTALASSMRSATADERSKLLEELFLVEGLVAYERAKQALASARVRTEISFNLFDLLVDREEDVVVLADSAGVYEPSRARYSIADFERLIDEWHAAHRLPVAKK